MPPTFFKSFKILKSSSVSPALEVNWKKKMCSLFQAMSGAEQEQIRWIIVWKKISPYFGWQCECVPRYGTAVRGKTVVQRQQDDIKNGSSKSERAAAAAEEERDELTG